MKALRTFLDVETAFKEFETKLNSLLTRDIDMQQRRVINAHPSIKPDDYVIRRELDTAIEQVIQEEDRVAGSSSDYDVGAFGIAINTELNVGIDVCPHHIVVHPTGGTVQKVYAQAKTPSVGADIKISLYVRSNLICQITIPANSSAVVTSTTIPYSTLVDGDDISCDVDQVGSSVKGGTIIIKFRYRWT